MKQKTFIFSMCFAIWFFSGCAKYQEISFGTDPAHANVYLVGEEIPFDRDMYADNYLLPKPNGSSGEVYAGKTPLVFYFRVPLANWFSNEDTIKVPSIIIKWVSGAEKKISASTLKLRKDGYRVMIVRPKDSGLAFDQERERLETEKEIANQTPKSSNSLGDALGNILKLDAVEKVYQQRTK